MWTDYLILWAIWDSTCYWKSGLHVVQAQLSINKPTHRYLLRVCLFYLDEIYNSTLLPDSNECVYMCTDIHTHILICLVDWGCKIHWLHHCRGITKKCPGYDTKQSDGEVQLMLELCCHYSQVHSSPER